MKLCLALLIGLLEVGTVASAHEADPPAEAPVDAPVDAPPPTESPTSAATTYALQPAESQLLVRLLYDRDAPLESHDHAISASTFTGSVTWSPADLGQCAVAISFPVTALRADLPEARASFGLEGEVPRSDRPKVEKAMLGKKQLDASRFPEISFTSSSCTEDRDAVVVRGTLSIHGVGAPVAARMTIDADGLRFRARGDFEAKHGDFGLTPFTALLGAMRNGDGLLFRVDVRGAAPSPPKP